MATQQIRLPVWLAAAAVLAAVCGSVRLPAAEITKAEAERILRDEKSDAQALFSVSFYFEQAGQPFSALKAIERAIAADPKVPGFHARYGQLLNQRRRIKESSAAYGKAAEIDPETKAFRAAHARACASIGMLKEAADSWRKLFAGASDKKEIKDAAEQIAALCYQLNDPAGAEKAWTDALPKLTEWDDRLYAANRLADAQLSQGAHARAVAFWQERLNEEKDWERRRQLIERMAAAATAAPAETRAKLLASVTQGWEKLLADAATPEQKQRAGQAVASAYLLADEPAKAVAVLKPLLYVSEWDQNFQTVRALSNCYGAQGDQAARQALWREFMEESTNRLPLEAGKKYALKIEYYQGGGPAVMRLYWSSPSQPKQLVPTARLFSSADARQGDGLRGEYFNGLLFQEQDRKLARVDPLINFMWDEGKPPAPGMQGTNFCVRWTGFVEAQSSEQYVFHTLSDEGVRLWVDGKLVIDHWRAHTASENDSLGLDRRLTATRELAGILETPAERVALWRETCKEFAASWAARHDFAEALAQNNQPAAALDEYEQLLKALRQLPQYQAAWEQQHYDRMIQLCAQQGDVRRAAEYIAKTLVDVTDTWRIQNWLSWLQNQAGFYALLDAIERLSAAGGVRRMGAAQFLVNHNRLDMARPLLEAAAQDGALERGFRQQALSTLLNYARSGQEGIEVARRVVQLGGDQWQRRSAYHNLAQYLTWDGRIEEALVVVRQADQIRNNNWTAGPEALNAVASNVFRGNTVGPGLRTPAGQDKAEKALLALAGEFAARQDFLQGVAYCAGQLAELHARRGDYDGAVDYLRELAKLRDYHQLHLSMAGLLERKGDLDKALDEYAGYLYLLAADYAANLRQPHHGHYLQRFDQRVVAFMQKHKKEEALTLRVLRRIEALSGKDREGLADYWLGYYKNYAKPEEMLDLLKKLDAWGHKDQFYRNEMQWAEAAIKLKNAASQADMQMRDQLLKQADQWKDTFSKNREDYGAALNVYKTYMQLGRRKDAEPFLEKAAKIAPDDPIVLELTGNQLMLDKQYAAAAQNFARAGEVSGRAEDFEGAVLSAFEMSGKSKEALNIALDSLAEGRQSGRGVRTVEQIIDLAERSDLLKFLYEETGKRMKATTAAGKLVREAVAQLALRLAWDNNDSPLATAALDALILLSKNPATPWQEEWRLQQLAQRAVERRQLADAFRIRRAMLDVQIARGQVPDAHQFREAALLLLQSGKAQEAADLLVDGLEIAVRAQQRGGGTPPPLPQPVRGPRPPRRPAPMPARALSGDVYSAWANVVLGLAGQEAAGGGKEFRMACGERINPLIEHEIKDLEKTPETYSGVLVNAQVETAFELRARTNAAYQAALAKPGASAQTSLAWARRLLALATRTPAELRDKTVTLEQIQKACADAVAKAEPRTKLRTQVACAGIYVDLLSTPEKERLAGVTAALVMDAFEACTENNRISPDILQRAMAVAENHRDYERAARYGRELVRLFPSDRSSSYVLARVLLAGGQVKDALETLRGGLDQFSNYRDYADAGGLALTPAPGPKPLDPPSQSPAPPPPPALPPTPEAGAGAAEFLIKAVTLYLEETGPQVDAKGRPLPDAELARLQGLLAQANAAAGKLDEAFNQFLSSVFNSGGTALDERVLAPLAEAYSRAGRAKDLQTQLEAKATAEPKSAALRLALATACEQADDWSAAANALRAAKALDPQLTTVKRLIAALRKAKDAPSALEECNEWASSFPRDADVYRTMAEIYKDLKDEAGEVRALTMLVEVAPRDADNCRKVAVLFASRKDFRRAVNLLERAIELRGEEAYRHVDLGEVLFMAGEHQRAEKVLKDALARDWEKGLSPELLARMPPQRGTFETRAHSVLGDVYEALKQTDAAARTRMNVPAGYKRPPLDQAVPVFQPRWWGWR